MGIRAAQDDRLAFTFPGAAQIGGLLGVCADVGEDSAKSAANETTKARPLQSRVSLRPGRCRYLRDYPIERVYAKSPAPDSGGRWATRRRSCREDGAPGLLALPR